MIMKDREEKGLSHHLRDEFFVIEGDDTTATKEEEVDHTRQITLVQSLLRGHLHDMNFISKNEMNFVSKHISRLIYSHFFEVTLYDVSFTRNVVSPFVSKLF